MTTKHIFRTAAAGMGLAMSLVGTAAYATPPGPGVVGTVIWQKTVGNTDYTLREITLPPHTATGWHHHDGNLYATVKSGTLSRYDAECQRIGFHPTGSFVFEPAGPEHVHIGRNLGDTKVVLEVLYVLPKGSPFSQDEPNPGCDFE